MSFLILLCSFLLLLFVCWHLAKGLRGKYMTQTWPFIKQHPLGHSDWLPELQLTELRRSLRGTSVMTFRREAPYHWDCTAGRKTDGGYWWLSLPPLGRNVPEKHKRKWKRDKSRFLTTDLCWPFGWHESMEILFLLFKPDWVYLPFAATESILLIRPTQASLHWPNLFYSSFFCAAHCCFSSPNTMNLVTLRWKPEPSKT